jgi:hypothetical protein
MDLRGELLLQICDSPYHAIYWNQLWPIPTICLLGRFSWSTINSLGHSLRWVV